jgi:hypothetical protein
VSWLLSPNPTTIKGGTILYVGISIEPELKPLKAVCSHGKALLASWVGCLAEIRVYSQVLHSARAKSTTGGSLGLLEHTYLHFVVYARNGASTKYYSYVNLTTLTSCFCIDWVGSKVDVTFVSEYGKKRDDLVVCEKTITQ